MAFIENQLNIIIMWLTDGIGGVGSYERKYCDHSVTKLLC